jgi:O-methyltransferase
MARREVIEAVLKQAARMLPHSLRQILKPFLVPLINAMPDLSERARWIRGTYTRFGLSERERLLLGIARFCQINRPLNGYYFEFGCHSGQTMRLAWRHSRHLFSWDFVAFDSFEGLPDVEGIDVIEIFQKGKLTTSEDAFIHLMTSAGMPRDHLLTVKGFYEKSLTQDLTKALQPKKAVVIYIDCDLYASTVPVLEFVKDFLQVGTIIVFDDWFCYHGRPDRGEQRAFAEFCAKYPHLQFAPYLQTSEAKSFIFIGDEDVQTHALNAGPSRKNV